MVPALALILACSLFNRLRGDDRWMGRNAVGDGGFLPGRALYYVAPIIGLLAAVASRSAIVGAVFAAAYFVWGVFPWGYLQLQGHTVIGKIPTPLEAFLLKISGGNVFVAHALRHAFALPLVVVQPLTILLPFLAVLAYHVGWSLKPTRPILVAELLTGALWGGLIATL